jgi:hypothetical protein
MSFMDVSLCTHLVHESQSTLALLWNWRVVGQTTMVVVGDHRTNALWSVKRP